MVQLIMASLRIRELQVFFHRHQAGLSAHIELHSHSNTIRGHIMFPMLRSGTAFLFLCALANAQTPEVQALLQKRCYLCHGPQQQMSNLRLDQKDSAMRVITPGKSAESRLIRMVSGAEKKVMPPVGEHLSAAEIATLRSWIDSGAAWTPGAERAMHWSFLPIHRPEGPDPARNPIDYFIRQRLTKENISPSP